jgi:glycosyltransferase domain-containing protein
MSMSDPRVSILIPSHLRPALLGRALEHYAPSGLPVIVADSSPAPFAGAGEFEHLQYLHLPGVPLEAKLQLLADRVATPYAVLCADDDFTSTASILRCAEFLDRNPDHSGAHGHYLRVLRGKAGTLVEPCYRDTHRAGIGSSDPATRLLELNRPYVPLFYAVLRAQVLREAFGPGHELERFYAASELALGIAAAALGKVAVLPTLHTVRDIVPSMDLSGGKSDSLLVVSTAPEYREAYEHMVVRLSGVLERVSGLAPQAARQAVLASLDGFIDGYCQPGKRRTFAQKLPKYCRRAAHALLPPLAARAQREAEARLQAELRAYLAPAGAEADAELARILARFRATPG